MTRAATRIGIIGGGAAGLAAAQEATRLGHHATIVAEGELGGDCTFTGCVPSKTLIESALRGASLSEAFSAARLVVSEIALTETPDILGRSGIEVVRGRGVLGPNCELVVDQVALDVRGVIVATGSVPAVPNIDGLEALIGQNLAYTSDTIWELDRQLPMIESMVIIGGGAIGCELGSALQRLGVSVTILEGAQHLLPTESGEVAQITEAAMAGLGIAVRTRSRVTRVASKGPGVSVHLEGSEPVLADRVLVAAGRKATTAGLGTVDLDERGFIVADSRLRTSLGGVYAAGDVTGLSNFTHAADAMGRLAASNLLRRFASSSFKPELVPRVVFVDPEVASIGLSEAEAAACYPKALVAELPLSEHDRARASGQTHGFIKLIAAPRKLGGTLGGGRLVGATIVAPRAGEMISELSLLMRVDAMVGRLAQTMHPYPSWSYGLAKAAGQFFTAVEGRSARPAVLG